MVTVAPIGALGVHAAPVTTGSLIQALVYIHTSVSERPEPRAAGLAQEGAQSVET